MKSIQQIIENYKSETLDGRDLHRLCSFLTFEQAESMGILKEGAKGEDWGEVKDFTRENILHQLAKDVEFGFEKALDQRGISAGCMYCVVQMWNWILEEGLEDFSDYAQYGLPLFKATANKYGFPNPIGDDEGNEDKYASNY